MLYTVEVRLIGGDLITAMAEMRTWLDHQRLEPDAFRHSAGGAGITFRVDFRAESEAVAFARAFGGRLIGLPARGVGDAGLWRSSHGDELAELPAAGAPSAMIPRHRH